jgi:hypothetical protein
MASLPATLLLPLLGAVAVAQPGELNVNESSYTAPERVCFRILRSIEGGTKVSPVLQLTVVCSGSGSGSVWPCATAPARLLAATSKDWSMNERSICAVFAAAGESTAAPAR